MSEIEYRSSEVVEVSYPKRTVTVIVAPYETPTTIHTHSSSFTEIITRGAYDGVKRRAGSIRANRNHNWDQLAGTITALYPERDEGLVADVKLFKTPVGQETLELCADDGLSASAGFGLMREGGAVGPIKANAEVWERSRTVRRLNALHLDHVAFVPDPAYKTATVLDVRDAELAVLEAVAATPNRDRIQVEMLRAQKVALDSRWGV